jgi:hypothetical protein
MTSESKIDTINAIRRHIKHAGDEPGNVIDNGLLHFQNPPVSAPHPTNTPPA